MIFQWLFFSHSYTPTLYITAVSNWNVWSWPISDEAHRSLVIGFICIASHLPCCIPCFATLLFFVKHITYSLPPESTIKWLTAVRGLNDYGSYMLDCYKVWPLWFDCSFYCPGVKYLFKYTWRVLIMYKSKKKKMCVCVCVCVCVCIIFQSVNLV